MHLVMIGGSDAGISAALRARELDPARRGHGGPGGRLPELLHLRHPLLRLRRGHPLAQPGPPHHRRPGSGRDAAAAGHHRPAHRRARPQAAGHRRRWRRGSARLRQAHRRHRRGPGPAPDRDAGLDALGPGDGVHLLHSMGDTFAVMRTLEEAAPASAVIVGAGYIGLEMADALTVRGLQVTQMEQLPEVLPTVDPQLGALVHAELAARGVEVLTGTTVQAISRPRPAGRAAASAGHRSRRHAGDPHRRHGPGRRRRAARDHPGGRGRGHARRQGRDRGRPRRCGPNLPDVFAAGDCVDHPPPAARRDLPAAGHHRAQAGPGRRGERPRREPAVRRAAWAPRW